MKNRKYKICFLILHYKLNEVTAVCIDSILAMEDSKDVYIVVIDNASLNGSIEELQRKYSEIENIHFLILKEGKGFSYANNLGFSFCKDNFNPDLIVAANNDIVFTQRNFIRLLQESFEKYQFHIMGPDIIITQNESHGNPRYSDMYTSEDVKRAIRKCEKYLQHPDMGYWKFCLEQKIKFYISLLKKIVKKLIHYQGKENHCISAENVELWGACLIFSHKYWEMRKYLFYPETFFYQEENILFYYARKMKMKVVYDARLKVQHDEGVATRYEHKELKKRLEFVNQCNLEGLHILLRLMKEDE